LFSDLCKRPVVLSFDQRQGSSDGGAVLLQSANRRYGLIESMADCLRDRRQSGKVEHGLVELMRQRIHGLACGYPDANDAARLAGDPMHKMLVGRDPVAGRDLASQPTLSRFENTAGPQALYRMGMELARCVIERHGKRLGGHARRIRVRLDGGFASAALFEFLDSEPKVEYVVAMGSNAVLKRRAEEAVEVARMMSELTDETEHVYDETRYAAHSWKRERRVIIKAEVVQQGDKAPKDNPRFVVTNMKQSPQWIYEDVYCQRGEIENRIKELKALDVDRTSCTSFWANQLRVLMTAAAYVLMQEIRLAAALTTMARSQVWTLRERLLKLGVRVAASVRRIVLHLPESFPFRDVFRQVAQQLGAAAG
jgi:hypothetical protein